MRADLYKAEATHCGPQLRWFGGQPRLNDCASSGSKGTQTRPEAFAAFYSYMLPL